MKKSVRGIETLALLFVGIAFLVGGCTARLPCPDPGIPAPAVAPAEVDTALFLVGDAGDPDDPEPVLEALGARVRETISQVGEERVGVVFLGDNLYPEGLPAPGHRRYEESLRRLRAQLAVVPEGLTLERPLAWFIPGNHDWGSNRDDGLERLARQAQYLYQESDGGAVLVPSEGCPGPEVVDLGEHLRLVALDTHWWLRRGPKPTGAEGGCASGSEVEFLASLEQVLATAGTRRVVLAGHHPLMSGGPHGDLCPLRRSLRIRQDISGRKYGKMIEAFTEIFRRHTPLLYAAGHEHNLQLADGDGVRWHMVSGSGCAAVVDAVIPLDSTRFCRPAAGFFRLDLTREGGVRIAAYTVEGEVYAMRVED